MTQIKHTRVASFSTSFHKISSSSYPLLLSTAIIFALSGCQTTSSVDTKSNSVQTSHITNNSIQLLNHEFLPSTSQIAKNNLFEAIKNNLDTDHDSIKKVQYMSRPYLTKNSIDKNDRSFYQTLIDIYLYSLQQKNIEESDNDTHSDIDIDYDATNYDELTDAEIDAIVDAIMAEDTVNDNSESDVENNNQEQMTSKRSVMAQAIESASYYAQMKQEEREHGRKFSASTDTTTPSSKTVFLELIMDQLNKTPKQVEALQTYYFDHYAINSVNSYRPNRGTYQGVMSIDYANKIQEISAQVPYSINFDKGSITLDPSFAKPFVTVLMPEKIDLLGNEDRQTLEMSLPDKVLQQLPTDVVFDALIAGVKVAFFEMDSENYTAVDIHQDSYAKKLGATQAIKVNFNSTQSGDFIGRVIKTVGKELKKHIENNPERYEDAEQFKKIVAVWSDASSDIHTADVGNILQIVESILPIRIYNNTYYYLSDDNRLLGTQSKGSFGSEFYGMTTDIVTQVNYNKQDVQQHPLYALSTESFSETAPHPINGNEWLKNHAKQKDYAQQARAARNYYDYDEPYDYAEKEEPFNDIDNLLEFDADKDTDGKNETESTNFDNTKQAFEKFESSEQ